MCVIGVQSGIDYVYVLGLDSVELFVQHPLMIESKCGIAQIGRAHV